MIEERRNQPRRDTQLRVQVSAGSIRGELPLLNISAHGGFVGAAKPPPVGTLAILAMTHAGARVRLMGDVARIATAGVGQPGFAIAWQRADAPGRDPLIAVLRGLGVTATEVTKSADGVFEYVFPAVKRAAGPVVAG